MCKKIDISAFVGRKCLSTESQNKIIAAANEKFNDYYSIAQNSYADMIAMSAAAAHAASELQCFDDYYSMDNGDASVSCDILASMCNPSDLEERIEFRGHKPVNFKLTD